MLVVMARLAGGDSPSTESFSTTRTRSFLPGPWRFAPLAGALLLGAVGVVVFRQVERAAKDELAKHLLALLGSAESGLALWMESRTEAVETLARAPLLLEAVERLVSRAETIEDAATLAETAESRAVADLLSRVLSLGFHDSAVLREDGLMLASATGNMVGRRVLPEGVEALAHVFAEGTVLSHPFRSRRAVEDDDGVLRVDVPIMFVATPLPASEGRRRVALALLVRPKEDFARLLESAQAGETGEVYAFDRDGLLLSQSRFDDELRASGLLPPDPRVESLLNLRILDPGVDLTTGASPERPRDELPLTRMAAAAVANAAGVDVDGYRDYRGVPVVGAWTWLDEHDMGLAVEQDESEAYAALTVLRTAFAALFALLVLVAVALLVAGRLLHVALGRMRRAIRKAERLGQYTLEHKLGEGGMGEVWLARHAMLRRPTAVKLLPPEKNDPAAIARFEQEVQHTAELSHPNTITIYDYGRTYDGIFYYAMELIAGTDLKSLVVAEGPLPQARVVHILRQVCGSLAEAHARGLVHRDVKPANIMIAAIGGEADVVRVLDFGLVKQVESVPDDAAAGGTIAGTPLYLAPESIVSPASTDSRSDLYALGGVAYWLLTGHPLFDAETPMECLTHQLETMPVKPSLRGGVSVSPRLEALVMACLAKNPAERPQSAEELSDRLAASLDVAWTRDDARRWWGAAAARRVVPPAGVDDAAEVTRTMAVDVGDR